MRFGVEGLASERCARLMWMTKAGEGERARAKRWSGLLTVGVYSGRMGRGAFEVVGGGGSCEKLRVMGVECGGRFRCW